MLLNVAKHLNNSKLSESFHYLPPYIRKKSKKSKEKNGKTKQSAVSITSRLNKYSSTEPPLF